MSFLGTSNKRLLGGPAARRSILVIATYVAIPSWIGLVGILGTDGSATIVLLTYPPLATGGLYLAWRRWRTAEPGAARNARHRDSPKPKRMTPPSWTDHPAATKSLILIAAYVTLLGWAGVMLVPGINATVVLAMFAMLATLAVLSAFRLRK